MRKTVKSSLCIVVGVLLIATAAFITGFNMAEDRFAGEASDSIIEAVSRVADERKAIWMDSDQEVIPDYVLNPDMKMPTVTMDDEDYIGILELPALGLKLGVADELTMSALKKSPCRYTGSIYDGDCVIAAHNYRSHFGRLSSMQVGDQVIFTDMDGTVFTYEVIALETISGDDSEAMLEGDWDLTLFTCTLSRTDRVTVRCRQLDTTAI